MNAKTRTYDKHWIPWTKKRLEEKGFEVHVPLMPEPWEPRYESFREEFEKNDITEDSVLVGHSCGCTFLVRWLGDTKKKVNKLILVAPWKIPDADTELRRAFYDYSIDISIKDRVNSITMFTANDEDPDGKESLKMFQKDLGGKVIELEGRGHYVQGDMGTEEFPELIEEIIS